MDPRSLVGLVALSSSVALPLHAAPPAPGAVRGDNAAISRGGGGGASAAEAPREGGELPMEGSVNAKFPRGEEIARWSFEAPGPGVLKVAVGGPEDLALAVVTPEGVAAIGGSFSDNDLGEPWSEQVEIPLFSAGTYEVLVGASYGLGGDGSYHLAAGFEAGEPVPSDSLFMPDIEAMRALAEATPLRAGEEAAGEVAEGDGAGWIRIHRVEAEPGLYAVTSVSGGDLDLTATSIEGPEMRSLWDVPVIFDYGDSASDNDFGGDLGAEGVVVGVGQDAPAWVGVRTTDGGAAPYRLKLVPLSLPEKPAGD